MAEAYVRYEVSVFAHVDTDTGEVLAVNVDDEDIGKPQGVLDEAMMPLVSDKQGQPLSREDASFYDKAVEVAESAMWPAWEFGF